MDALLGSGMKAGSMVMDDSVLVMVAAAKECGDVANDLSAWCHCLDYFGRW